MIGGQTRAEVGLALCGLTKSFGSKSVVRDVSLECSPDSRVSILGPSGCGKSTLLRLIVGLEQPDNGDIMIGNQPGNRVATALHIAYLGQRPALLPWLTALDNALLPLRLARPLTPIDRDVAGDLFDAFGLKDARGLMPGELSGGMRQRVALVQSLIVGADILLLDEPFAALDDVTRRSIICQLHCWIRDHHVALIMVTHSFEDAAYLSNRTLSWRHSATKLVKPQLHEISLGHTFSPTGVLNDFAQPEFIELKSRMFSEYIEVDRNLSI
jgi:ABC-type nitrate/sulfonate/bicarbonate transport system ATPase subunit